MTPIIVLTARAETEFKTELLSAGADDYMVKPFSFAELVARAKAVLRRPVTTFLSKLSIGAIELDTAERTASVAGEPVALTPREFALLEYLMRHTDRTVSRTTLLEHVFPRDSGNNNVLDVHMKNLRKKVGKGAFATVRGVGYRLNS